MTNKHTTNSRRSTRWLRRLVRCHGHILKRIVARMDRLADKSAKWVALDNLDWGQSAYYQLGNSIHAPSFALESLGSLRQRTPRKNKCQAWSCGDTLAISRLNQNHPENGGDASGRPPTPAQPTESSEQREYKETMKLESMQSSLRTITSIVWMILGLQIMKEVNPTMSLWLRLPIASALSSLLTSLLPICENRLLHLWRSDSCDKEKRVAMTPNDSSSATAPAGEDERKENQ